MSGHSKWAQIKRQKGVADIKRGQFFTKIAKAITITVREGGGVSDPSQNFRLRLTIEKARAINMPKENIERAIERGKGKGAKGEEILEVIYEGFGPGGVAVIVEAATDNKQRTTAEVKNLFDKNNASLGVPGAVSYQFQTKGEIVVKKNGKTLENIFLIAADLGAEDVEDLGEEVIVYTKPEDLARIKEEFLSKGLIVDNFELIRKPIINIPIKDLDTAQKILTFIEKLESLDEVQKVYSSFDIPDEILKQLEGKT